LIKRSRKIYLQQGGRETEKHIDRVRKSESLIQQGEREGGDYWYGIVAADINLDVIHVFST
jgi:hypothetical protein